MCRAIYFFCINIMLWVLLPTGSPHYCEEEAEATIILVSARRYSSPRAILQIEKGSQFSMIIYVLIIMHIYNVGKHSSSQTEL